MADIDLALLQEHQLSEDVRELVFEQVLTAAIEHQGDGFPGPIVDRCDLLRGHTFTLAQSFVHGVLELRQYSSSLTEDDLDSAPPMDVIAVWERMSKVEEFLLGQADARFAASGPNHRGWLTVDKVKTGADTPGYQKMLLHPRCPDSLEKLGLAASQHGAGLPTRLEIQAPADHVLGEFRGGLTAIIPPDPTCAFETVIYFRPGASGRLCELSGDQRWGLAQAVREVTGALRLELAVRGLPEGYSWQFCGGPALETYLHLRTGLPANLGDSPPEWAARFRDHLGLA